MRQSRATLSTKTYRTGFDLFAIAIILVARVTPTVGLLSDGHATNDNNHGAIGNSNIVDSEQGGGGGSKQMADVIAIKEGADLDLSCPIVVPNEDMIISWTCDDEPANIRSSRIHVTETGKLRIHSARVGDSCNYRCEAADGFGTLSVIIKVLIVDRRLMEQLSARHRQNYTESAGRASLATNPSQFSQQTRQQLKADEQSKNETTPSDRAPSDLDIQVEPHKVQVGKNKTFSLECRVKHPDQARAPQIIWLKEFIGPRPNSLADASDQNLILLDDVYYHSLNWPRSISYSKKSASANSALLVRQSSFVHSGRYVCFAGYPSSTLMTPTAMRFDQKPAAAGDEDDSSVSRRSNIGTRSLKYRMAQAIVRVDDQEGEMEHKLSLEAAQGYHRSSTSSRLLDNLLSNSWARNFIFVLLSACCLLLIVKIIHARSPCLSSPLLSRFNQNDAAGVPKEQATIRNLNSGLNYRTPNRRQQLSSSTSIYLEDDEQQAPNLANNRNSQQQSYHIEDDDDDDVVHDLESIEIIVQNNVQPKLLSEANRTQTQAPKLKDKSSDNSDDEAIGLRPNDGYCDHVYSEIGDGSSATRHPKETAEKEEPYYKKPNLRPKI